MADKGNGGSLAAGTVTTPSFRRSWTPEEVRALGTRTDIPTAGAVLGLNRAESYRMVARGDFPLPVVRLGRRSIVPVSALLALLRLDSPGPDDREQPPGHGSPGGDDQPGQLMALPRERSGG